MDGRDILKVASRETACLLLKQILCCAFESKVLQILMKTLICRKVLSTTSIKEKASPCVGWLVQVSMLCKSSLIPGPSLTLANWSLRCSQCSQTNNRNWKLFYVPADWGQKQQHNVLSANMFNYRSGVGRVWIIS